MEAKLSTNPLYSPFLEILDMVCLAIDYWYHLAISKEEKDITIEFEYFPKSF